MSIAALAAVLILAADAPAADPAAGAAPDQPRAEASAERPQTATRRVCEKLASSSSRTPRRVCRMVTTPVEDAEAAKADGQVVGAP